MSHTLSSSYTATESGEDAVKAAVFQRLHPRVYLERFLQENIRPDGRTPNAWRDILINVGKLYLPSYISYLPPDRLYLYRKWIRSCTLGGHYGRLWCKSRDRRARTRSSS
jgi:hypothetical protein